MAVVSLKDVHKFYPLGKQKVEAVKGVSFDIEKGEFAAISGPSGSGKSTILNMVGLIDLPSSGSIIIGGTDVYDGVNLAAGFPPARRRIKRKSSARAFPQSWTGALHPCAALTWALSSRPSTLSRC